MGKTSKIGMTGNCHFLRPYDGSSKLVIFFGAKDLIFDKFNFFQLGRELTEHCLFINNGVNQWYQNGVPGLGNTIGSTIETIRRWQKDLGAKEVIMIGTSMGGFGAIQYGSAMGARVLAFATDSHLLAPHSQSARFYSGEPPTKPVNLSAILKKKPTNVTIFAGERDVVDLKSASELAKLKCVTATTVMGAGHILPTYLSRSARLGPLIRQFVNNEDLGTQLDRGEALTRKGYIAKVFAAFTASKEKDWKTCAENARQALENYPYGEAANLLLGQALLQQNKAQDAIGPLSIGVATQPEDLDAKLLLATAMRSSGGEIQARKLHGDIIAVKPDAHRSWYALGVIALQEDQLHVAQKSVETAIKFAPEIKVYRERLKNIISRRTATDG